MIALSRNFILCMIFLSGVVFAGEGASTINMKVASLLQGSKAFKGNEELWSLTVMKSYDGGFSEEWIKVATTPKSVTKTVCETKISIFRYSPDDSDWYSESENQGLLKVSNESLCSYRADINSFYRIKGDYLPPNLFENILGQVALESSNINQVVSKARGWEKSITEVSFDNDKELVKINFYDSGCELNIYFTKQSGSSYLMNDYSEKDVICKRK